VTRGTRPKKPSSSRGFARGARGVWGVWGFWGFWGFWGLKTKNRKLKIEKKFSFSKLATSTKKIIYFILFYFFRVRTNAVFTVSADGKNPFAG
jgi:hypothetical protein